VVIEPFLGGLLEAGGSDLHLKAGSPPMARSQGELIRMDFPSLTDEDMWTVAEELLPPDKLQLLRADGDAEVAKSFPGRGRYRINLYSQRDSIGLVARLVTSEVPAITDLHLPPVVERLANERRGLILVTGPAGTGKTTTIASIIGQINHTRRCHIITLEDPIEVVHTDDLASIDQREIGVNTVSYASGLRHALRQDPDVLFIGEIRDGEAAEAALNAAETGHLVISTMHTIDAAETLNRFVDLFPAERHKQVRITLAGSLRAVISQRLVRFSGGWGRLPAVESMVVNGRVADLIEDPTRSGELNAIIAEGASYGMQTFEQALVALVQSGAASPDEAQEAASNKHDFMLALANSMS